MENRVEDLGERRCPDLIAGRPVAGKRGTGLLGLPEVAAQGHSASFDGSVSEGTGAFAAQNKWHADLDLCEELMEQGSLQEAKRWLTGLHRQRPDSYDAQELLLEVLFREGLSERDFEWIEEPSVVRLNRTTRDRVYSWIRTEGGLADILELRYMIFWGEYLCFDEEALAKDLARDDRFRVCMDGPSCMVETLDPI